VNVRELPQAPGSSRFVHCRELLNWNYSIHRVPQTRTAYNPSASRRFTIARPIAS
jgi:hypothetical protein